MAAEALDDRVISLLCWIVIHAIDYLSHVVILLRSLFKNTVGVGVGVSTNVAHHNV